MTEVSVEDVIDAPLERAWALVSDFAGFLDAMGMPCSTQGEGIGMTRTFAAFGPPMTERLEELDESTHTTSYSIVESTLPLKNYQAWIQLTANGDNATGIRWWGRFEPADGDEAAGTALVRGVYEGGIAGVKKALAPQ